MSNISKINSLRMTGLVSGLDVDSIVKQMLAKHQSRLDKVKQQKALLNWQKDAYRSVITSMSDFQSKFLDILSPSSVTKTGNFKSMVASVPSGMSQYFTASATSDALNSSVTVNSIKNLATAQKLTSAGSGRIAGPITMNVNENSLSSILGQSISFSLNGETKNITLDKDINKYSTDGKFDISKLAEDLNEKLENAFGSQGDTQKISVSSTGTGNRLVINIAENNTVQISSSGTVPGAMGFENNATNYINTDKSIASIFGSGNLQTGSGGSVRFTINGVAFSFASTTSMKDVMSEINKSSAGVNISYSSFSDSFTLTSKDTGSGDKIRLSESVFVPDGGDEPVEQKTNILSLMFGINEDGGIGNSVEGKDAVLTVNGLEIVRNSNTVIIDGITLNLLQETPEFKENGVTPFNNVEAVSVKADAEPVVDMIKGFVEGYNSLVNMLSNLLTEKREKSGGSYYMPLTDEQKAEMSEKDIELWEEMGKKGLLANDATIMKILSSLRTAMAEVVKTTGGSMSMFSIGIKPASYFEDRSGKLTIDEDALRKAIENDPDAVMKLFTQQSTIPKDAKMDAYYRKDELGRYYEETANGIRKYVSGNDFINMRNSTLGIAQRFTEIFESNIKVSMDPNERGTLILKVGTGGAYSVIDSESSIDKRLAEMDRNITKMQNRLYAAETKYYKQFAALETAIAKLNKQASYLGLDESQQ